MPQMAPIYWLYLFFMFILSLILIAMLNYFIKPFNKMEAPSLASQNNYKHWKL